MYADGHFDVAASASMFFVPVKTGDQVTVTSTVGPGSAGTVTAYAFQLDTKRAIISTLFSYVYRYTAAGNIYRSCNTSGFYCDPHKNRYDI